MWVSAAEGFVIISGLLVGYVHGYKKRSAPLLPLAAHLIRRGIMLYAWMILTTVLLVAVTWYLHLKGNMSYIPIAAGDWPTLIRSMLRLDYVHSLTHFLYLYAMYLVISPAVIWLLRRGQWLTVVAVSCIMWWLGLSYDVEWLQWQILFFVPASCGYYFEQLLGWFRRTSRDTQRVIRLVPIAVTAATVIMSQYQLFKVEPGQYEDMLFGREPLTIFTILLAGVWFAGMLSLFQYALPILKRYGAWLLPVFGSHSLTAYIVHIVPIVVCQLLFASTDNIFFNSTLTALCILATWGILKIPGINRVVPR